MHGWDDYAQLLEYLGHPRCRVVPNVERERFKRRIGTVGWLLEQRDGDGKPTYSVFDVYSMVDLGYFTVDLGDLFTGGCR